MTAYDEKTYQPSALAGEVGDGPEDPLASSSSGDADDDPYGAATEELPSWSARSVQLAPQLAAFERAIAEQLSRKFKACLWQREQYGFSKQVAFARTMAEASMRMSFNAAGEPIIQLNEGAATEGIQVGFSAQGIDYAKATLMDKIYETGPRFFVFSAASDKQENESIVAVLTDMASYFLRQGHYKRTASEVCGECPTTGVGIIRCQAVSPVVMERDPQTGRWGEKTLDPEFRFESWPLEDVLVTDYQCAEPEKQEGVFWFKRGTTVGDLMQDEAVYETVPLDETGTVTYQRTSGEFFNLRWMWKKQAVAVYAEWASEWGQPQAVSDDQLLDTVTYEGRLNLRQLVEKRVFTPEIADFFGIDLGLEYPAGVDPATAMDDESFRCQFALRASRINWTVGLAWKSVDTYEGGYGTNYAMPEMIASADLIALDDGRNRKGPNTMFRFPWLDAKGRFLAEGIPKRGMGIERNAIKLANALVAGAQMGANPCVFVDVNAIEDNGIRKEVATTGLREGKAYATTVDPEKVFKPFAVTFDPRGFEVLSQLKEWFERVTGIGAEVKGQDKPSTGTLGEIQMDAAAAGVFLRRIVLDHATENFRMIRTMLETYEMIMGREGIIRLAYRVSPHFAEEFEKHYTSMPELLDEFQIDHPSIIGANRVILFEQILKLYQGPGQLTMDPRATTENLLSISGVKEIESWMIEEMKVIPVPAQHRMMQQGNYESPGVFDPHEIEVPMHIIELDDFAYGRKTLGDPELDDRYMDTLTMHIAEHNMKADERDAQLQMQQMGMGDPAMGGAPQPDGGGTGLPGGPTTAPPDETRGTQNVARAATRNIPGGAARAVSA